MTVILILIGIALVTFLSLNYPRKSEPLKYLPGSEEHRQQGRISIPEHLDKPSEKDSSKDKHVWMTAQNGHMNFDMGGTFVLHVHLEGPVQSITSKGSVHIYGSVGGDVKSKGSVVVQQGVGGSVKTTGRVECGDVGSNVNTTGRVQCGNVRGNVNTTGRVEVQGNVGGGVQTSGKVFQNMR